MGGEQPQTAVTVFSDAEVERRRATAPSVGAHTQAKRRRRSPDAFIQAQQPQSWERRSGDECGCQVNGIQRPNRLACKWLPRTLDDVRTDPQHMPV